MPTKSNSSKKPSSAAKAKTPASRKAGSSPAKSPAKSSAKPSGKASGKTGTTVAGKPARKAAGKSVSKDAASKSVKSAGSSPKATASTGGASAGKQPAKTTGKTAAQPAVKAAAKTPGTSAASSGKQPAKSSNGTHDQPPTGKSTNQVRFATASLLVSNGLEAMRDEKLPTFLRKQKQRLLALHDSLVDSMSGVAHDNLRTRTEGNEGSAFGMHQADAGSDAYDRDFALSLLSQEQDALFEIDEALRRIEDGSYGVCQMSGKKISHERLEAIPFARFTVECQAQIERQQKALRIRQPVTSLFGLGDSEGGDREEEETSTDSSRD